MQTPSLWNRDFVLETDVDLSSLGTSWSGIGDAAHKFTGTFNGNGHTISNLTMTTGTQGYGLFGIVSGATIKNIALDNAHIINSTSSGDSHVGGIVGQAIDSTITNCSVTNSTVQGYSDVALICGHAGGSTNISNCYAQGTVKSTHADAGGITGELGDGSHRTTGTISNCYTNCTVTIDGTGTAGYAGGIAGKNTGIGSITNCTAVGTVSVVTGASGEITSESSATSSGVGSTQSVWSNSDWGTKGSNPSLKVQNSEDYINVTTLTSSATSAVITPSLKSIASNIENAFKKANITDVNYSQILNWLTNNYETMNDANNKVVASFNYYAADYLKDGSTTDDFATKLANDIRNNTTSESSAYQDYYNSIAGLAVQRGYNEASCGTTVTDVKGSVEIPTVNTIAKELYYALVQQDSTITESQISSWLNNFASSDEGKVTLANINEMINNGSDLSEILTAIKGNDTTYSNTSKYNTTDWDVTFKGSDDTIDPTYGSKKTTETDGTFDQVLDHYEEEFDHYEYYWDTTDPQIANAIAMYFLAKRHGITVVTDEQAASKDFLTNVITAGAAVFTTFNPSKIASFANLSLEQRENMTDEEYNQFMGIENTSVSVRTTLREVSDEKDLKKSEAKYEADMKRIDLKDRKYDTDLAALETERTATKEEMETLKTVAKDNVERTFKPLLKITLKEHSNSFHRITLVR